ncbi:MAG TPA: sialidase family protein, partial [Thermoanaerobaculia bacterium]|nr:sialidase family protein [Thermoanaerobaculia bacterium]
MKTTWSNVLAATAAAVTLAALALPTPVDAQITAGPDINLSQKAGADSECAIAKNPANPLQLFASCNTASAGLFATRSTDGGTTWTFPDPVDRTIADGDLGQGAPACCDPTLAWDSFGNLFITYLAALVGGSSPSVETLLSTDGGLTFTPLASFAGSQDQPTIVAENTTAVGAPVAVWIVWNQSGQMRARGAAVTGLGAVGAFGPLQTIPGTSNCSFGDVAIAPDGTVVQACQNPTGTQGPATIRVNIDADGLGIGNFGAVINATTTNVGGFD